MKFEMTKRAAWSFFRAPELEEKGILHGFCTGGVSSNLLHEKTRQDFLGAFSLKGLVVMNQEHGNDLHVISGGQIPRSGDGLIILERNVAGIIKTADCLPIILCDTDYPMASIIHAGWRGTIKGITGKAVSMMEQLGSAKEDMVALLGPSIGPCCYEVKEDVYSRFIKDGFPENIFHAKRDSLFLDLKQANAWMLRTSGVSRVYDLNMCTYCNNELFYSFRRGDSGNRQINFVSLNG